MTKRTLGLVAFLALAGGLALAGAWLLLTSFKPYDDEGYVLLSLVNYAHGGRLYADVYTQYGPFFYAWSDALHRLFHFEFNHLSGRALTLAYWLGAAIAAAAIVDRTTRSLRWSLLALATTFAHLWQMTAEPGHPGGLITFLVAVGAWAGAENITRGRWRSLAFVIGLIGAALALTKINVGLFFIAGAGGWWLLQWRGALLSRLAPWVVGLLLAICPWLLMHSLLAQTWVQIFAAIASLAGVGVVVAALPGRRPTVATSTVGWLGLGLMLPSVLIGVITLCRYGALSDLMTGVLLGPLRHPGVFFFAVDWRPGTLLVTALSLALLVVSRQRGWTTTTVFARTVACARVSFLLVALTAWFGLLSISALGFIIGYGPAFACWCVIPLSQDEPETTHVGVRAWLGLLAVTQILHAYPVGGSQIGWGTFLFAPLLIVAAVEAIEVLRAGRPANSYVAWLAPLAGVALGAQLLGIGWQRWHSSEPLRLTGAEYLRLPEALSARLRALTLNAEVHGGTLFSLPGLYSFNLWTGLPTPTQANATHWFSLLSRDQMTTIADRLLADPRSLVIVERSLLGFMREANLPVTGPLHDDIVRGFSPVFTSDNYELWARRGRSVAPLSTAHLYVAKAANTPRHQLVVCMFAPPGARVARIEWIDCRDESALNIAAVFDAANSQLTLTPLAPGGQPSGPSQSGAYPAALPPFVSLSISTDTDLTHLSLANSVLRLRGPDGQLIAEAVFAD